jgi:hypothetical protein
MAQRSATPRAATEAAAPAPSPRSPSSTAAQETPIRRKDRCYNTGEAAARRHEGEFVRARAEVAAGTRSLRVSAEVWRRRIIIRSGTGFAVGKKLYPCPFLLGWVHGTYI